MGVLSSRRKFIEDEHLRAPASPAPRTYHRLMCQPMENPNFIVAETLPPLPHFSTLKWPCILRSVICVRGLRGWRLNWSCPLNSLEIAKRGRNKEYFLCHLRNFIHLWNWHALRQTWYLQETRRYKKSTSKYRSEIGLGRMLTTWIRW